MRFESAGPTKRKLDQITVSGFKFWIRPEASDDRCNWDEHIVREVVENDTYELRKLAQEHPEIKNIVDVGAHIGAFSVMAIALWPAATINSFEPFLDNYSLFLENLGCLSDSVKAHPKALVNTLGAKMPFRPPAIARDADKNTGDGAIDRYGPIEVDCVDAAIFVRDLGGVDLMKLDCEGMEGPIIRRLAAEDLLGSIGFVRGEFHGEWMLEVLTDAFKTTHEFEFKYTYQKMGIFKANRR